jgi:hypothetical protein
MVGQSLEYIQAFGVVLAGLKERRTYPSEAHRYAFSRQSLGGSAEVCSSILQPNIGNDSLEQGGHIDSKPLR